MYNFSNYSLQYNSCGNIGCNKCSTGPTGPGGNFQDGSCYGDYLYWDNNVNKLMHDIIEAISIKVCKNDKLKKHTLFQLFGSRNLLY